MSAAHNGSMSDSMSKPRTSRRLSMLLAGLVELPTGMDRDVLALSEDSRRVVEGSLFIARQGSRDRGDRYLSTGVFPA